MALSWSFMDTCGEVEQVDALPSYFGSNARFLHLFFFFVILLLNTAPKCAAEVLPSIPTCKKALLLLTGKDACGR